MKFSKKTYIIIGVVVVVIILLILFEKMSITDSEIKKIKGSQVQIINEKEATPDEDTDIQYINDSDYEIEMKIKINKQ